MSRRDARRHAFILIFQIPFHDPFDTAVLAEARTLYFDGLDEPERPSGRDLTYIERVTGGVLENLPEIDAVVEFFLKDWKMERIGKTDLALLRLGMYELQYAPDIPAGATINEIVELAHQYGADESPSFVNGVLGGAARMLPDA